MALSKQCPAQVSFCGKLGLRNFVIRVGSKLDDRADEAIANVMSKNQKASIKKETQAIFLKGGGQVSVQIVDSTHSLLARDYPQIVFFDGKVKLGLIFIPKEIIPKHAIDLFPELLEKAKEELKKVQESGNENHESLKQLEVKIRQLEKDNKGDIPEREAGLAIKEVFKESFATLVIHSLEMLKSVVVLQGEYQEFDFLVLDLATATIYAVEVKRTLTLQIPKGADKNVADKVLQQLQRAFGFLNDWFGADVCKEWKFKPVIFCLQILDELNPLCDDCDMIVTCGRDDFIAKLSHHVKSNRVKMTKRLVEDFKLMSRYLIFGISAKNLPTTSRFPKEVTKYMSNAGSWESILLWCFLTPGQMELLSKPKVVFFSGWGGGKTTTGIEVCKNWSKTHKVLILVNGFKTHDQTMLLVHSLRLNLKKFKNIDVQQIDFVNYSLENLMKMVDGYPCLFLDEMLGDPRTLKSISFKNKFNAMTSGKSHVWVALSNFDIVNENALEKTDESLLGQAFPGFTVVSSLNQNMRNPRHIQEQVQQSGDKLDESGSRQYMATAKQLNNDMKPPTNLILLDKENPQSILQRVFVDKTMKAVLVSAHPEDALLMYQILKIAFGFSNIIALTPWSPQKVIDKDLQKWILWNPMKQGPNILVTFSKMINGFDVEAIISLDNVSDEQLGDVASRATNQFINWNELSRFLNAQPKDLGFLEMYRQTSDQVSLASQINPHHSQSCLMQTLSKPSKMFPCGLMEILFKATTYLNLTFELVATDAISGQQSTLNLTTKSSSSMQTFKLTICASRSFMFLTQDLNGQDLQSPDLSWSLSHLMTRYHSYTILPKIKDHETNVIVNNDITFVEAIKQNMHENACLIYFYYDDDGFIHFMQENHEKLCKALHSHLGLGNLNNEHLFKKVSDLTTFLETFQFEASNVLLIDLTFKRDVYQKLPTDCKSKLTYFKCNLQSYSEKKLLEIMEDNLGLYEICFGGKAAIQDDPLNFVHVFNHILSPYGYTVRSKFFLEYGNFEYEDNFNQCLFPLFENVINDSNEAEFEALASQFWDSFKGNYMDFPARMQVVKQLFQKAATTFQQTFCIMALINDQLKLTKVYKLKPQHSTSTQTIHVLYIFHDFLAKNGFLILDKTSTKMFKIPDLKRLLKPWETFKK